MGTISPGILHVDTGHSWRGGQQQAAYLVEALHLAGHRVAMVCQPHSKLVSFCRDRGIPCFPIPMWGEWDARAGFRIAAFSRRFRFEILHLHTSHALTLGLWAKLFLRSLRLVAVRRVELHIKKHVFSHWKYGTKRLDRIVCISEAVRQVLIADGISSEKMVTIHSGIDLSRFQGMPPQTELRAELGIPDNHLIVGTVAAMAGLKDYPNLLKAARYVLSAEENVTFCAVGDGAHRKKILRLAVTLQLGCRFIFAGFQNEVGRYLRLFDLFVLASRKEGLGTSILDALAVGLPVIACRTGGIVEVVDDGKNGLLVPPRDPHAFADAMLSLIRDEDLRKRMAHQARKSVEAFDIRLNVQKNIQLYQDIS